MKKFFILLLFFGAAILIFLGYNGLFSSIEIKEKTIGPFKFVYKEHIGSYSETGKLQSKINDKLIAKYNILTERGFGIYFDNPKTTEEDKLRSEIGRILQEKYYDKIHEINKEFKIKNFKAKKCVTVEFPFKSHVSVVIGTFRVYPKLKDYISEKGYKKSFALEIYDYQSNKIIFAFPIKK